MRIKFRNHYRFNRLAAIILMFGVVATGAYLVARSHAATAPNALAGISIPGTHLSYEDSAVDLNREMQLVEDSGSQWVRFDVAPVQIEQTQGVRDWSNIDRIVASATAHNLKMVAPLPMPNAPPTRHLPKRRRPDTPARLIIGAFGMSQIMLAFGSIRR